MKKHSSYDLLGTILMKKLILYIPVIVMYIGRRALVYGYYDIVLVS